jgi:hypothetical protein
MHGEPRLLPEISTRPAHLPHLASIAPDQHRVGLLRRIEARDIALEVKAEIADWIDDLTSLA